MSSNNERALAVIPQGDAMVTWLADQAASEARHERVSISAPRVELNGVGFAYHDNKEVSDLPNPLPVVILGDRYENRYYESAFRNGEEYIAPDCFAISDTDESEMKPHPLAMKPQAESCASCPLNEFGSAKNGGEGKACSNRRRLALIGFSGDIDTEARIATMNLPPTIKNDYAAFKVRAAKEFNRPLFAIVADLHGSQGNKTTKIAYEVSQTIETREHLAVLYALKLKAQELLDRPYEPTPEGEKRVVKKPSRGVRVTNRKKGL